MRPSFDEYFLSIADTVSTRSTCKRRNVGCVITKDNRIIATGYNGAPEGFEHCDFCIKQKNNLPHGSSHELCRAVHAEQNAITQCAKLGIPTEGTTVYITHQPCSICSRLIASSGVNRVVYKNDYPDDISLKILDEAGIPYEKL